MKHLLLALRAYATSFEHLSTCHLFTCYVNGCKKLQGIVDIACFMIYGINLERFERS